MLELPWLLTMRDGIDNDHDHEHLHNGQISNQSFCST
jgi:hypothetical protein